MHYTVKEVAEIAGVTAMFNGLNKDKWGNALSEQSKYLEDKYGYELPEIKDTQVDNLNEQAAEAQQFIIQEITHAVLGNY